MKKLQLLILFLLSFTFVHAQINADFSHIVDTTCGGLTINFTDQSTSNGNITSWLWDFADGNTSSWQNPIHTYTMDGTYNVCLSVTDDLGQMDMICIPIVVINNPTLVCIIDPNIPILSCTNGNNTATLDGSLSSSGPNIIYEWSTHNGNILFGTENVSNPIIGATGNYTMRVKDTLNGCVAQSTVSVTGDNDFPVADVQASFMSSCSSTTATLDGSGSSSGPEYSYEWKVGNFTLSTNPTITVDAAGTYEFKVSRIDMPWCSVSYFREISSLGSGPDINIPVTAINDTIVNCMENLHYSADLLDSNCTNCTAEIRDANDSLICNALPCILDISSFGFFPVHPFTLRATDNNTGCTSAAILPQPPNVGIVTSISITDESCGGAADGIIDLSIGGTTAPFIFDWLDISGSDDSLYRSNLTAGTYTIQITDVVGCIYPPEEYVVGVDVTADAGPDQTINCALNTTVTLDGSGSNASSGSSLIYDWFVNGNSFSNTINLIVSEPGIYTLVVTDITTGCTASDEVEVFAHPGNFALNMTTVACAGDLTTINFATVYNGCDVEVTDAMGNVVCSQLCLDFSCSVNPADGPFEITLIYSGCPIVDTISSIITPQPINAQNTIVGNVSCNGVSDGFIDIIANGGAPPYTYAWSTGDFTQNLANLAAGSYDVTITDANGCQLVEIFTILEPAPIEITNANITPATPGNNDGAIDITVTGGIPFYTFQWSDSADTEDRINLATGPGYTVTITDANGCTLQSQDYVIPELQLSNVLFGLINDTTICMGETIQLADSIAAGYSIEWSPSLSLNDPNIPNAIVSPTDATTYFYAITTPNGNIFNGTGPTINVQMYLDFGLLPFSNGPICEGDTLKLYSNLGTSFMWSGPDGFTSTEENPIVPNLLESASGDYNVTITDNFGCTAVGGSTVFIDNDCVWPGDTDTNKVVNHFDLLNIGLAFDSMGTTRYGASFDWMGQPSQDWSQSTPNTLVNYKHIDTDGNGVINSMDTLAITQNFGQLHNLNSSATYSQFTSGNIPPVVNQVLTVPFYVEPDTLIEGATIGLDIILGDVSNMVTGLYGIAFSIEYDSTVIVPGSPLIDFANTWLGDINSDAISVQFDFPSPGRIDASITRIDGVEMDGFGIFGELIITLEDDILLWNDQAVTRSDNPTAEFKITNYHLINFSEEEILVNAVNTTAVIDGTTSISKIELDQLIEVYPNPTDDLFYVASKDLKVERIRIYSATGELKGTKNALGEVNEISTKDYAGGIYFIEIQTTEGVITKKLNVIK